MTWLGMDVFGFLFCLALLIGYWIAGCVITVWRGIRGDYRK